MIDCQSFSVFIYKIGLGKQCNKLSVNKLYITSGPNRHKVHIDEVERYELLRNESGEISGIEVTTGSSEPLFAVFNARDLQYKSSGRVVIDKEWVLEVSKSGTFKSIPIAMNYCLHTLDNSPLDAKITFTKTEVLFDKRENLQKCL